MADLPDSFSVDPTAFVAQDTTLRGNITIHSRTVLHPKVTLLALTAPIIIGSDCILEENVIVLNRTNQPLLVGDHNHFQIGARIESPSIGKYNTFSPRSFVPSTIAIQDWTTISAGTAVILDPFLAVAGIPTPPSSGGEEQGEVSNGIKETLPSNTVVWGTNAERRIWNGVGVEQQRALYEKHLAYLLEILPKKNEQRIFPPS